MANEFDTELAHIQYNAEFNRLRVMWKQVENAEPNDELKRLIISVRQQARQFAENADKTFNELKQKEQIYGNP